MEKKGDKLSQRINRKFHIEHICYFAGLLDGEGCIYIQKGIFNGIEGYRIKMAIGMTNKTPLNWLSKHIGGKVYNAKPSGLNTKECFQWVVNMREGNNILKQALPYLIVKKKQAINYIKFCATSFFGKQKVPNERLTPQILAKREKLYWNNKKLNKKGN